MEGLDAHHWASNQLDKTVIRFQNIVEILNLPDRDKTSRPGEFQDQVHCCPASQICAALIDDRNRAIDTAAYAA
jgi:hypothetical protein